MTPFYGRTIQVSEILEFAQIVFVVGIDMFIFLFKLSKCLNFELLDGWVRARGGPPLYPQKWHANPAKRKTNTRNLLQGKPLSKYLGSKNIQI